MRHGLVASGKRIVHLGLLVQLITSVIIVVLALVFNSENSFAIFFGCVSFVIPHNIFAYWVFRYAGATKNELVAQSFSQGMKIKLILTSLIFVIAFSQLNLHPLPLLSAYAIIMVSQWLAVFWLSE